MKAKEYLTFTKRERNGILSVIAIMLAIVFSPKYFCKSAPVEQIAVDAIDSISTDTIKQKEEYNPSPAMARNRAGPLGYTQRKIEPFDINLADTTKFIALPGIGSKLAARIVMFRDKLGGFYDVKQIGEVYGLKDSVFRMIFPLLRCDARRIHKIDINTAGKEELKAHPYIRWNIAEALVTYRDQHGSFTSMGDFWKLENIDAAALEKIMPYISFKN